MNGGTHTQTHTRTHTYFHTNTPTCSQLLSHTHTHTHTPSWPVWSLKMFFFSFSVCFLSSQHTHSHTLSLTHTHTSAPTVAHICLDLFSVWSSFLCPSAPSLPPSLPPSLLASLRPFLNCRSRPKETLNAPAPKVFVAKSWDRAQPECFIYSERTRGDCGESNRDLFRRGLFHLGRVWKKCFLWRVNKAIKLFWVQLKRETWDQTVYGCSFSVK